MRRARGWIAVALALAVLWGGRVQAEDTPAADGAAATAATEAACTAACQAVIGRCTSVFGPAMGDMRPFCAKAVVRRCRAMGVAVCEPPTGTR